MLKPKKTDRFHKFYSPLKIGFLIVALAYFLFTFHAMFTLSWIGEWEFFSGSFRFVIFVEDITAGIGIASRLVASTIAFAGIIFYFVKKGLSTQTAMKLLRLVLIGEAIFWLGLLASGVLPLFPLVGLPLLFEQKAPDKSDVKILQSISIEKRLHQDRLLCISTKSWTKFTKHLPIEMYVLIPKLISKTKLTKRI
jgi:hypothetical protein